MRTTAASRENNFDALRILAASAVIYGHAHPLTATPSIGFFGNGAQAIAVKVFFIVSGFLIARSWMYDPRPVSYLIKRSLRIFPALLLCLAFTVLILGAWLTTLPLADYFGNPATWWYGIHNAVLYPVYTLPGVFTDNIYPAAVNGSLWSLPVEFMMYLVFPLVYAASRLVKSNVLVVGFTVALCVVSVYTLRIAPAQPTVVFYGTALAPVLDTAPYFFLGAVFAVTKLHRTLNPAIGLFVVGALVFIQPASAPVAEVALYLAAPYCVLSFATMASPVLSKAGRFGDPSYGIYVYSFPIQQAVVHFIPNVTPIGNTLISLPFIVAAAYLSWHLVEKHALAFKPKRRTQDHPGPAVLAKTVEIS